LLVVPHELGHAIVARCFRFENIRIFIGFGRPLFSFHFAGFVWIINRVPVGGLTYATMPLSVSRWKWILYAAGGLVTNAIILVVAWFLLEPGALNDATRTPLEALFWANLLVIAANLAPYTFTTPWGSLDTDGKLLLDAVFRWKKPPPTDDELPTWQIWTARLLKTVILLILSVATLTCAAIAYVGAFAQGLDISWMPRLVIALLMAVCAVAAGSSTWRIFKQPVATIRRRPAYHPAAAWLLDLHKHFPTKVSPGALQKAVDLLLQGKSSDARPVLEGLLATNPDDVQTLINYASACSSLNEHSKAEEIWSRIITLVGAACEPIYAAALSQKLAEILRQGDVPRFIANCQDLLNSPIADARKVTHLDELACIPLYENRAEQLQAAEFCVRAALERAPHRLTLKGTLGGVLVERGLFTEAEPLLNECYQSDAHHDQGISAYYLAVLAETSGNFERAASLARAAIIFHPQPWLVAKALKMLERTKKSPEHPSSLQIP
jgi:tetratricopeptide (TPR) repeat protein